MRMSFEKPGFNRACEFERSIMRPRERESERKIINSTQAKVIYTSTHVVQIENFQMASAAVAVAVA